MERRFPSADPAVGKPPLREPNVEFVMNALSRPIPKSSGEFSAALCAFINHELPLLHAKMSTAPGVTLETPLFATGLIDSMAILHLIAYVEDATGRSISPEEVVMKHFATVAAIVEAFWRPADARI